MTAYKQPSEKIPLAVEFSAILPAGETLLPGSDVKVFDAQGQDKTSIMLVGKTVGTTRIDAIIQAGSNGITYDVQFTAVTANYKFEEDVVLIVREI